LNRAIIKRVAPAACALLVALALPVSTRADASTNLTACGAVMCLAGVIAGGSGGAACDGYITQYFSIIRWHHGHMDLGATSDARMSFLNQCDTQGSSTKQSVNDRYGTRSGL
jgi:hypothetical protein